MHFLLLLVRLMLGWVMPELRDSLTLAARADGRVEHLPLRPRLWDRWLTALAQCSPVKDDAPPRRPALAVRADAARRRLPGARVD